MKLLPRLYAPTAGRVLIDGYDIDKVELYSLRRQIGIVPQEPLLFSGSVSDNIALTDPNASGEEIAKAAEVACAHEFIMGLPSGRGRNGWPGSQGRRGAWRSGTIIPDSVFFSLPSHPLPGKVGLIGLQTFSFFSSGIVLS